MVAKDSNHMKHFVGLTTPQFEVLYDLLNDVCPLNSITYWSVAGNRNPVKANVPANRENVWSNKEKLFICLLRLKRGFAVQTLAFLLSTPEKQISATTIRNIFTTFIQLMFKISRDMEYVMFPSKELLKRYHPVALIVRNSECKPPVILQDKVTLFQHTNMLTLSNVL